MPSKALWPDLDRQHPNSLKRIESEERRRPSIDTARRDGESYTAYTASGTTSVSYKAAHVHKITLTGSITPTFSGATSGIACGLTLYLVQGGSGSYTVTWPSSVLFPGGNDPTLSTTVGATDVVVMETVDGGVSWFANLAGKAYA